MIGAMHPLAPASPSRRRAARQLAMSLALSGLPLLGVGAVAPLPRRTFDALCDTLVPADALTPSASALGVAEAILADVIGNAPMERLVALALTWLEEQADGRFAAADADRREAILQRMAELPPDAPLRRFFDLMRNSVMAEYYARPGAWRGLALDRPPQPLGFFDAVGR